MNKKSIISTAIAVLLTVSTSVALAQNHGNDRRDNDRHDNDRGQQQHQRPDHNNYKDHGRNDRQNYQVHGNDRGHSARGAGPRHDMRKGGRISNEYRGNQYVVNDWRGHHLSAPPRGSHWVQTGGDYVLVAVATGIIAQILLSN